MSLDITAFALPLFVPGDRPERFAKAVAAGPDAVIIDLEDAVAAAAKVAARDGLRAALADLGDSLPLFLRINAPCTEWHEDDLRAARDLPLAGIILPKAEEAADLTHAAELSGHPVIALVETARGLQNIDVIAGSAARIAFGSIDFAADLAMGHTRTSLLFARARIVLASRLAGLPAPIDGVTVAIREEDEILSDCAHSVELGFGGKLLIHPAQIAPARRGFAPSEKELDWARRVEAAAASGDAALTVDGAMVDAPVIARARQIIARAI